jgi:hypothetical protein
MEIKPRKTVRFTQLVKSSGHPVPVTLWTAPEDDRDFSKAIKGQRVLTVIQRTVGAKADYGLVGFFKEPLATYLVFPKKLEDPAETKVVGIKYEQLAEAKPKGPVHKPKEPPPGVKMRAQVQKHSDAPKPSEPIPETARAPHRVAPPKPKPPPEPVLPRLHRFHADVEITFRQVVPVEVEASSATEAARLVRKKMEAIQPTLEDAKIKRRASKARKLEDKSGS